jgi:CheY-like chemotaxis protein
MGLGLAMVADLVFQMGARMDIESLPGRGTAFSLLFPTEDAHRTREPQGNAKVDFTGGAETILLVEDSQDVRTLFERVLSNHGYKVLTAACGAEAIAAATSTPVDLLITDVVMPRMDGPMLAKQIAASQPKIRVIFVSGYSPAILEKIGRSSNEVSFLQKPLLPEVLLVKIREVLSEA